MPILKVDAMGNLYVSGRDRSDGLGCSSYAVPVSSGDTTLGSAYLKAERERNESVHRENQRREQEHQREEQKQQMDRETVKRARRKAMTEEELMNNEFYRMNMLRRAMQMGHTTGIPASSMRAYDGSDRTQEVIRHAMTGRGSNVSYSISPEEQAQRRHQDAFTKVMAAKARAQEADYRHDRDQARRGDFDVESQAWRDQNGSRPLKRRSR